MKTNKATTEENQESGLAVITSVRDLKLDHVPEMIDTLTKQINALSKKNPDAKKVDAELPNFGKIKDMTKVQVILKAMSMVKTRGGSYVELAKEEGISLTKYPFKLANFSMNQWMEALRERLHEIENKTELDNLNEAKNKLSKYLSKETAFQNDMGEIFKTLIKKD